MNHLFICKTKKKTTEENLQVTFKNGESKKVSFYLRDNSIDLQKVDELPKSFLVVCKGNVYE